MCTSNMPTAVMSPTGVVEATTSRPSCSTTMDDRGDFVDSEDEGDIEEVAENPNLYPEGLLYPICIGEIVADRYRIDHKLGHGSFSTVWMAYDTVRKVEVALKILMHGDAAEREYRAQQDIVQTVLDTTHLLLYKDTFFLHSPHGEHRVLVFPLQGPNLRDYPRKAPVATRMSFSVQLLQALKSLHSSGFVHRGEFIYLYWLSSLPLVVYRSCYTTLTYYSRLE